MGKIEEADSEGEDEGSEKEEEKEESHGTHGEYGHHHEDETLKYTTNISTKSDTVTNTSQKWVKHTSASLLSNPAILERKIQLDASKLANDDVTQRNWISTNHELFEIARRLLPGYYKDLTKQRDENGLERSPEPIKIDDENSYLINICNLFKIQFYFLLRYNHYNTYSKF